jgi:hypothetical protein
LKRSCHRQTTGFDRPERRMIAIGGNRFEANAILRRNRDDDACSR